MRIALLTLLIACSSSSPKPPPAPAPSPETPTSSPSSTGPLSEAEFKALHELPGKEPGPRKGQRVTLADGSQAYLSLPAGDGPHPGIVVIHEWWGLNGHVEAWADRLATAGWAALAVDLYGGVVATDRDTAMKAMKSVDNAKGMATIRAALDYLTTDAKIQAPVQAVIGWCFGGAWSLQTAIHQADVDGAIIYYGRLETDPEKLKPIKARLLGVFGTKDEGIPMAEVDKFEAALKTAGVTATIHRYEADHAFANPSNPKYDEANAGDAWSKVVAFLESLRK
jgi:carboxymethylenebutenolidase